MDADDQNFPEGDLTRKIIGAAMAVLKAITGLPVALLLNFKASRLTWKRVTRSTSA
jgi:hypothetical protein